MRKIAKTELSQNLGWHGESTLEKKVEENSAGGMEKGNSKKKVEHENIF